MLRLALVALSFGMLSSTAAWADAKAPRGPLFHLADPHFTARLKPETRSNLAGTSSYVDSKGSGTAFIVHAKDGRALAITSDHVPHGENATMMFSDGSIAKVKKVIARSPQLDYALMDVELPANKTVTPLKLSGKLVAQGEHAYSIGAPGMGTIQEQKGFDKLANHPRVGRAIAEWASKGAVGTLLKMSSGKQTSSFGWVSGSLVDHYSTLSVSGASGGPVISSKSHEVLAVNRGRDGSSSVAVPSTFVLGDVQRQLEGGQVDPEAAHRVAEMLRASGFAAKGSARKDVHE